MTNKTTLHVTIAGRMRFAGLLVASCYALGFLIASNFSAQAEVTQILSICYEDLYDMLRNPEGIFV